MKEEVIPRLERLVDQFYNRVPAGVGSEGLSSSTLPRSTRCCWEAQSGPVKKGYGVKEDLGYIEERGPR